MPGGNTNYHTKAKFIMEEAMKLNDNGTIFPLFGICLGL